MASARAKCDNLPQESGARLCSKPTPRKFPEVVSRGAQFRWERQDVGLVPLPVVGNTICAECGAPSSVAHSAFECPPHTKPREVLLATLDGVCSGLGLDSDHHWWGLSASPKLCASFCPIKGTIPAPKERAFLSRATSAWGAFYEVACNHI